MFTDQLSNFHVVREICTLLASKYCLQHVHVVVVCCISCMPHVHVLQFLYLLLFFLLTKKTRTRARSHAHALAHAHTHTHARTHTHTQILLLYMLLLVYFIPTHSCSIAVITCSLSHLYLHQPTSEHSSLTRVT